VRVRLKEMRSFGPGALEPQGTGAQHDMRIAAKRLRYVLESTEFCLGRSAATARRRARDLQDLLGELHDCDVMLPRVEGHLAELRPESGAGRPSEPSRRATSSRPRSGKRATPPCVRRARRPISRPRGVRSAAASRVQAADRRAAGAKASASLRYLVISMEGQTALRPDRQHPGELGERFVGALGYAARAHA